MTVPKQEILNTLHRLNWNDKSILEVAKKLNGFYGIIKLSQHEIAYSDSKDWKVSEENAFDTLQRRFPRSRLYIVKDKSY